MTKWWMVRAGDSNELISIWKEKGIASIGWPELGNPKLVSSKDELLMKAEKAYPDSKAATRMAWVSQVWRYSREIENNDKVITYDKNTRRYMVGTVTDPHFYNEKLGDPAYPNHINVQWEDKTIEREVISPQARNSLGSSLTVFRIDEWGTELQSLIDNNSPEVKDTGEAAYNEEIEQLNVVIESLKSQANDLVQDLIFKLDPYEMQRIVGGLLVAMDYKVRVSPPGPDGGVDVLAHKDAFGFEKPIIKVQVKHQNVTTGSREIRELLGAHPFEANSIFVSRSGFKESARKEAKQNNVQLIDLEQLVSLVLEWYEHIPNEVRALIPLKRTYLPEIIGKIN